MSDVEVASLHYYPIKSCGGTTAAEVGFSEYGLQYDREWMLIGANGQFLSQRTHPELALVQTRIEDEKLITTAPRVGELAISLEHDPDADIVPVTVWKKSGTGTDQGADAAQYFSEFLGRHARLLRIQQPRLVKPECLVGGATARTAFADGFPILLASDSSFRELNTHGVIDAFRANIIIEGAPAYDEDYWREVRIGSLRAFIVRACARCPVPNIDQDVGILPKPAERHVSKALRATRKGTDMIGGAEGEFFGQNVIHVPEPGVTVRVGDKVSVVERAQEPNFYRSPTT